MEVKTNPFYELRNRLYASAAAGCSLIAEDFRLKRAIEAFQPMSEANKVFGKLYAMCNALLVSENKPADIIDCIALADALAVTQGTFADSSETEPAKAMKMLAPSHMTVAALEEYNEKIRKTPYAEQDFGADFYKHIADPRLMSSFLEISGKNGGGTADLLIMLGAVYGEDIVQVYFDMLDHADEKANGNQLRYIADTYRDKYNDEYIRYAEDEKVPQGIRIAAIEAMAYSAENDERLTVLYKTSKGKVKNAALLALAKLNSPAAEDPIRKMAEKPKKANLEFLAASGGKAAYDYAKRENEYALNNTVKFDDPEHPFILHFLDLLANKKQSLEVYEMYIEHYNQTEDRVPYAPEPSFTSINAPLISNILEHDDKEYRDMIRYLYGKEPVYFSLSALFLGLMEEPETACKKICTDHRVYDRDVMYVLRRIFSTPDGWYRIRKDMGSDSENYVNVKLFRNIPDDILDFMTDPMVIYNYEDMMGILKTGQECAIAKENMDQRCKLFHHLLRIANAEDRERVRAAAEKFAWAMIRNYPSSDALELLPKVASGPMDGAIYNYIKFVKYTKIHDAYWRYLIEHCGIPEETLIGDLKRLREDLIKRGDTVGESYVGIISNILKNHGVKE